MAWLHHFKYQPLGHTLPWCRYMSHTQNKKRKTSWPFWGIYLVIYSFWTLTNKVVKTNTIREAKETKSLDLGRLSCYFTLWLHVVVLNYCNTLRHMYFIFGSLYLGLWSPPASALTDLYSRVHLLPLTQVFSSRTSISLSSSFRP